MNKNITGFRTTTLIQKNHIVRDNVPFLRSCHILLQECFNHSNVHIAMKIKSTQGLANWQCSRMDNNKINKQIFIEFINQIIIGSKLEVTTEHSWKKRLTSNTGSGLYSANYWRTNCVIYRPMHFKGRKPWNTHKTVSIPKLTSFSEHTTIYILVRFFYCHIFSWYALEHWVYNHGAHSLCRNNTTITWE